MSHVITSKFIQNICLSSVCKLKPKGCMVYQPIIDDVCSKVTGIMVLD